METSISMKGVFKNRYGSSIKGKDWIKILSEEDKKFFVEIGLSFAEHGHLGGVSNALKCKRNEKGKFCSKKENKEK